jgi:hypothetical protein
MQKIPVPFEGQMFRTHQEWVNKAQSWLTSHPQYNNTEHGGKGWRGNHFAALCFDSIGRRCTCGADMRRAEEEGAFPVWWIWPDQICELVRQAVTRDATHVMLPELTEDQHRELLETVRATSLGELVSHLPASYTCPIKEGPAETFQSRIQPWMLACFGEMIAGDREERNHRFLEEALELVQSTGCSESEAHQLVDYVYGRAVGEPSQEVGGVMVTLAALCLANKIDMHDAGEVELARIWTKVEQIRAKQAGKPKHSPLPGPSEPAR